MSVIDLKKIEEADERVQQAILEEQRAIIEKRKLKARSKCSCKVGDIVRGVAYSKEQAMVVVDVLDYEVSVVDGYKVVCESYQVATKHGRQQYLQSYITEHPDLHRTVFEVIKISEGSDRE